ncbi:MAG TPA: hypothetical protein VKL61_04275 [Candidatus Polarisedimenticolia bacterium]|nr:hypothetical protein [Candidatus Polarisedimenticolia bacterium]
MRPAALLPLLSFSVLGLEIGLTRIFSYLLPYHFTGIAVALAMTGLGLGAWARLRLSVDPGPWFRPLSLAGLAVGTLLVPIAAVFSANLPWLLLPPLLAFLAAGALVSDCYRSFGPAGAGRAYGLDLAGAASGCLGAVWMMNRIGSPGLCLALSAAVGLAALVSTGERRPVAGVLSCAAFVTVCVFAGHRLERTLSTALPHAPLLSAKLLGERLKKKGAVLDWSYSSFGRADLYRADPERPPMALFNDGVNPTLMVRRDVDRETLRRFFVNLPFELARPRRVLLIGTGAGLEVRLAREAGAETIEAVEVNPAFIRLVRRWRDYAGEIYDAPGVRLKVAEGRRTLEGSPGPYDLIAMSLVLSGTQHAASYAPAESFLFTAEAYSLYLSRLAPAGLLSVVEEVPERTLRQFMTALGALRGRGLTLEDALKHLAVVAATELESGVSRQMLLVSPEPLSPRVLAALQEAPAGGYRFAPLWLPGRAAAQPYASVQIQGEERFLELFPLNVRPCKDDRPYFFNLVKGLRNHLRLATPYLCAAGGALLATLILSFLTVRAGRLRWGTAGLAAAYGFLFVFCEVALLVRLTLAAGGPVPALTILLFSLLAWASLGGRLSVRLTSTTIWRLAQRGGLAALALAATTVTLGRGYRFYMGLEGPALPLALALTLAPCGLAMGLPFPALLSRARGEEVAGLWGVNGLASVAGAMLAVLSCMYLGISTSLLVGAFLYAATGSAAALLLR